MQILKDMPVESQAYGWLTALFGALTLSEWSILIGVLVTICGYIRESRDKNGEMIQGDKNVKTQKS